MLGHKLHDPHAVESAEPGERDGLGLLPLSTSFLQQKTTVRVSGVLAQDHPLQLSEASPGTAAELFIEGYEIHMGTTMNHDPGSVRSLFNLRGPDGSTQQEGWGTPEGQVWGTYLHGLFHNDGLRRAWLDGLRLSKGLAPLAQTFSAAALREQEFDRLADTVRANLDMAAVYEIMGLSQQGR
ncbi:Cobyric acid synthase [compost metagenome]